MSAENHAVNDVSFELAEGEFLGLVGESGCGKSTIAKMIMGMLRPDKGRIFVCGKEMKYPYKRHVYKDIQMVFQMPKDSFDPRRTVGSSIADMQRNFGKNKKNSVEDARYALNLVGLGPEYFYKLPSQMSGGECQRAAIARALAAEPKIVICDEPTSSLDVSVQAQIVELLCSLRQKMSLSVLFISHDLALVGGLCERVMVMNNGTIVEMGQSADVLKNPQHEYTKRLIASVLEIA